MGGLQKHFPVIGELHGSMHESHPNAQALHYKPNSPAPSQLLDKKTQNLRAKKLKPEFLVLPHTWVWVVLFPTLFDGLIGWLAGWPCLQRVVELLHVGWLLGA